MTAGHAVVWRFRWTPDILPVFPPLNQAFAHRVVQNVLKFLGSGLFVSSPMLKEIRLPLNAVLHHQPSFPIAYDLLNCLASIDEGQERVQVVGHQKEQVTVPISAFMTKGYGIEHNAGDLVVAKSVRISLVATNGDEIGLSGLVDPDRNVVRELDAL